jgi:acyl carrier protein
VEEIVAQIWSEVLSLERVSIYDHFFDLGGHSLLATQLLLRVHDRLQVEVPLRAFFAAPTVAAMAEIIVEQLLQHITPEALEQMLADTGTPPSSS